MRNYLYVRGLLGIDFPKVKKCSYRALRLPVQPVVEDPERKWGIRNTVEQRRGTFLGVGQECGE
jgi:hypothetical protein